MRHVNFAQQDFTYYLQAYPKFVHLDIDHQRWLVGVLDKATDQIRSTMSRERVLAKLDKDAMFKQVMEIHEVEGYFIQIRLQDPVDNPGYKRTRYTDPSERGGTRRSMTIDEQVKELRAILTLEFDELYAHCLDLEHSVRDRKCAQKASELKTTFFQSLKQKTEKLSPISGRKGLSIFTNMSRQRTASHDRIDQWIVEMEEEHGKGVAEKLRECRSSIIQEYRQWEDRFVALCIGKSSVPQSAVVTENQPQNTLGFSS